MSDNLIRESSFRTPDDRVLALQSQQKSTFLELADLKTKTEHRFDKMEETLASLAKAIETIGEMIHQQHVPGTEESKLNTAMREDGDRTSAYESLIAGNSQGRIPVTQYVKPPAFDGKPETAISWLREYEMAAGHNFWTDSEMVKSVGRCLIGSASDWFRMKYLPSLLPGSEVKWKDFKVAFKDAYFRESDRLRLLDELRTRKMAAHERPSDYFYGMRSLCHDYDADMSEEHIVSYIVRGMGREYQSAFSASSNSLNDIERIIRRLEDMRTSTTVKVSDPGSRKKDDSRNSGRKRIQQTRNVNPEIICYNCLEKGHYLSQCKQPKDLVKIRENSKRIRTAEKEAESLQNVECGDKQDNNVDDDELLRETWNREVATIEAGIPQMPMVKVIIKGKNAMALVDTGARVSIMSNNFRLERDLELEPWTIRPLKMANGSLVYTTGFITTVIKVAGCTVRQKFVVMERSLYEIILGSDFCREHKVQILFDQERILMKEPGSSAIDLNSVYPTGINLNVIEQDKPEESGMENTGIEARYLTSVTGNSQIDDQLQPIFAKDYSDVGCIPNVFHDIDTGSHPPVSMKPRRLSHGEKELVDVLINDMLNGGIIQKSVSPWSCPCVLVPKKDQEPRFCVDYRELNKITLDDPYPIPRLEDALDLLEGCVKFSKLDVAAMYWHIRLTDRARLRSAFVVPQGHYEFLRMPFGLKNAPATAARTMTHVLAGYNFVVCYIYFDDILVFGKSQEEHDKRLRMVLERLRQHNVKLRKPKCEFNLDAVDYLGYHIGKHGICPSESNIATVIRFPEPKSCSDVRRFCGLCSYFRKFIPSYVKAASPLQMLLRKDSKFVWGEAQQKSFDLLKKIITAKPVLACFVTAGDVELHTDASDNGIGAVLLQQQTNRLYKPVCYVSRTLSPAEKAYGVTEKECLAIVWSVMRLRHYLYGRRFTVVTDHCGLCWFMTSRRSTPRLTRWSLKLQEFTFDVKFKSGRLHGAADCLSRYPVEEYVKEDTSFENPPTVACIGNEEKFISRQEDDSFCQKVKSKLVSETMSRRSMNRVQKKFVVKDGILYFKRGIHLVPVLPASLKNRVLLESHSGKSGGHLGVRKTLGKMQVRFYWPRMSTDIARYVTSCQECQLRKPYNRPKEGKMIPIYRPENVLDDISLDIMEMPVSETRFRYLVVMNDRLSKFGEAVPIVSQTSEEIISAFYGKWIMRFGVPKTLITDRGRNLMSEEFQEFLQVFNITHKPTTAYHPQSDGQTERFNAYLGTTLSIYAQDKPTDWEKYLQEVLTAYNSAPHVTTKMSPFYLLYGREMVLPMESKLGIQPVCLELKERLDVLKEFREIAKDNIETAQDRAKIYYDRSRIDTGFKVGDLALVKKPILMKGRSKKFVNRYKGPYKITKKLSPVVFEVVNAKGRPKFDNVHVSRMKPFRKSDTLGDSDSECGQENDDSEDFLRELLCVSL